MTHTDCAPLPAIAHPGQRRAPQPRSALSSADIQRLRRAPADRSGVSAHPRRAQETRDAPRRPVITVLLYYNYLRLSVRVRARWRNRLIHNLSTVRFTL